jgi:hypothetical protein
VMPTVRETTAHLCHVHVPLLQHFLLRLTSTTLLSCSPRLRLDASIRLLKLFITARPGRGHLLEGLFIVSDY